MDFPLEPITENCKSYYGRAHVVRSKGLTFLRSYQTYVACVTNDGELHRLWSGWSATTGRHLVEFARQYAKRSRLPRKSVWDRMKVETVRDVRMGVPEVARKIRLLSAEAKA